MYRQHGSASTLARSQLSLTLFAVAVIGGLGSVPGALLGAGVPHVRQLLAVHPRAAAAGSSPAASGVLFILMVFPSGLGGSCTTSATRCSVASPGAAGSSCRACSPTCGSTDDGVTCSASGDAGRPRARASSADAVPDDALLVVARPRRRVRADPGAVRRRLPRRAGRDRGAARHQRRRQVHAAQRDLRARRARRRGDHLRRRDITGLGANATVGRGHRDRARRQGRLPDAHRRGEPRPGRRGCSGRTPSTSSGDRAGARVLPDPARTVGARRPATSRAASSRCSRWARRSSPSPSC